MKAGDRVVFVRNVRSSRRGVSVPAASIGRVITTLLNEILVVQLAVSPGRDRGGRDVRTIRVSHRFLAVLASEN